MAPADNKQVRLGLPASSSRDATPGDEELRGCSLPCVRSKDCCAGRLLGAAIVGDRHGFADCDAAGGPRLNRLLAPAQCYKSVVALVEKALGRAAPAQRLNVLYALSAVCRRSKAQRGVRDKYGERCSHKKRTSHEKRPRRWPWIPTRAPSPTHASTCPSAC